MIHKHSWKCIESDFKGKPTKYICIQCLEYLKIPSKREIAIERFKVRARQRLRERLLQKKL